MNRRAGLPLPEFLNMPLRDLARGVSGAAHFTEDALEPVYSSLPAPVQSALSEAMQAIKSRGASMTAPDVDMEEIAQASGFFRGQNTGPSDASTCAKVVAFAWDRLQTGAMASETLLSTRLANIKAPASDPYRHAAGLVMGMADSHAFGKLPGFAFLEGDNLRREVGASLIAPSAWLLADREPSLEAEMRLLELAKALSGAFEEDIRAGLEDEARLARLLETLSNHL